MNYDSDRKMFFANGIIKMANIIKERRRIVEGEIHSVPMIRNEARKRLVKPINTVRNTTTAVTTL